MIYRNEFDRVLSRENAVLLGYWALLGSFVAVSLAIEFYDPIGWFVAFAGLGYLAPQIHLSRTDDTVPGESRIRIGVLLAIAVGVFGFGNVGGSEERVVLAICLGLFVALLAYEFVDGYRTAEEDRSTEAPSRG